MIPTASGYRFDLYYLNKEVDEDGESETRGTFMINYFKDKELT
jgi:hypothetical protein